MRPHPQSVNRIIKTNSGLEFWVKVQVEQSPVPLEKFSGKPLTAKSAILTQRQNQANLEHCHCLAAQRMDPYTKYEAESSMFTGFCRVLK